MDTLYDKFKSHLPAQITDPNEPDCDIKFRDGMAAGQQNGVEFALNIITPKVIDAFMQWYRAQCYIEYEGNIYKKYGVSYTFIEIYIKFLNVYKP